MVTVGGTEYTLADNPPVDIDVPPPESLTRLFDVTRADSTGAVYGSVIYGAHSGLAANARIVNPGMKPTNTADMRWDVATLGQRRGIVRVNVESSETAWEDGQARSAIRREADRAIASTIIADAFTGASGIKANTAITVVKPSSVTGPVDAYYSQLIPAAGALLSEDTEIVLAVQAGDTDAIYHLDEGPPPSLWPSFLRLVPVFAAATMDTYVYAKRAIPLLLGPLGERQGVVGDQFAEASITVSYSRAFRYGVSLPKAVLRVGT